MCTAEKLHGLREKTSQFKDVLSNTMASKAGICGWGETSSPPIFSNLPESWSKISHNATELAKALSVTFCSVQMVGQMVNPPPPQWRVSRHITDLKEVDNNKDGRSTSNMTGETQSCFADTRPRTTTKHT